MGVFTLQVLLSIVCYVLTTAFPQADERLKKVFAVFREGEPHSDGLLSEKGMKQMYSLGEQLCRDYCEVLSLNISNIHVVSANTDQSLQSARCFITGLYSKIDVSVQMSVASESFITRPPIKAAEMFTASFNFTAQSYPHPIHTYGDDDALLNPKCANTEHIRQSTRNFIKEDIKKFQTLIEDVLQKLKQNGRMIDYELLVELSHFLESERKQERTYGISDEHLNTLIRLNQIYQQHLKYSRLTAYPLLDFVLFTLNENIIDGKSQSNLIVASAGESIFVPILLALNIRLDPYQSPEINLMNSPTPPFASYLLFELYEQPSLSEKSQPPSQIVRVKFNGQYISICENNSLVCTTEQLSKLVQQISSEYEQGNCGRIPKILKKKNQVDLQKTQQNNIDAEKKENYYDFRENEFELMPFFITIILLLISYVLYLQGKLFKNIIIRPKID